MDLLSSRRGLQARVVELAFGAVAVITSACGSRTGLDVLLAGDGSGAPPPVPSSSGSPMSACTPPAAGAVVTLATSPNGWGTLAGDSTAVYGINGAGGIALDATSVYWGNRNDLLRGPK